MATAEVRSERARIAALTRWANEDSKQGTERARASFRRKFELEVDPDGVLDPDERARRADCAMRAHMSRIRLAQVKSKDIA